MDYIRKFVSYNFPQVSPEVSAEIDRKSMRNIYIISCFVLVFETLTMIAFISSTYGSFGHHQFVSAVHVAYCLLLCGLAVFLSRKMFQSREIAQGRYVAFKVFFFVAFSLWAISTDFRHYKVSEQMLTFYTVNLVMACFIIFKPWLGAILFGGAYLVMYLTLFFCDGAAKIELLNYIVLALVTIACNSVLYHSHIHACERENKLQESNRALTMASHMDALTGLQNRLALEEDAATTDGKPVTAFMVDIDYFKEINDKYGHAVGDQLLKRTSVELEKLFPGSQYYRYGGDEFLVLSRGPAGDNYGSSTFSFMHEETGIRVSFSVGSAQGEPAAYDDFFKLISLADKALYAVKKQTHSVEHGGHERRNRS